MLIKITKLTETILELINVLDETIYNFGNKIF